MKKPSFTKTAWAKLVARMLKTGNQVRTPMGRFDTPRLMRNERVSNKNDFGLSPFYLSLINRRSLHNTAKRFHRKVQHAGPLGMDWFKSVR